MKTPKKSPGPQSTEKTKKNQPQGNKRKSLVVPEKNDNSNSPPKKQKIAEFPGTGALASPAKPAPKAQNGAAEPKENRAKRRRERMKGRPETTKGKVEETVDKLKAGNAEVMKIQDKIDAYKSQTGPLSNTAQRKFRKLKGLLQKAELAPLSAANQQPKKDGKKVAKAKPAAKQKKHQPPKKVVEAGDDDEDSDESDYDAEALCGSTELPGTRALASPAKPAPKAQNGAAEPKETMVNSKSRTGEYINEDGELALAYETQKTINKQLELELQDEQTKYKAHEREYKVEIEKLREDNERQQRLLSEHLQTTPQSKSEAYMQHEIARLTTENLKLRERNDANGETIRELKKQIKLLVKKLKDSGMDMDETLTNFHKTDDIGHNAKHTRALPTLRKKDRDYSGMFSYHSNHEADILQILVNDLKPRTAVTMLPGLPSYIIFMCVRHIDFTHDEDKVQSLLSNFMNLIKKVVNKAHEDFETLSLWMCNTLTLFHLLKQYSGDVKFQKMSTPKQIQQCLRNFDLSEYRQIYADLGVWIYNALLKRLEEKIQQLIVPAILEHDEIKGMGGNKLSGNYFLRSSSAIESPGGTTKPTTALLHELNNHHKKLKIYGVDNEVISQIFKQIFYFICASSLNNLLLRKELCHWSKGYNIMHNLAQFELWTRDKGFDEEAIQSTLKPIVQASQLLQAGKTDEDVATVCDLCTSLSTSQICKILNLYTPVEEFEQRVPQSFISKVQKALQEREGNQEKDNLLMDPKYRYVVQFPFKPSSVSFEDVEVPDVIQLSNMLQKV